jgi:LssY C-terminus
MRSPIIVGLLATASCFALSSEPARSLAAHSRSLQSASTAKSRSASGSDTTRKTFRVDVDATKEWVDSNIEVRGGEILRVTASGKLTYPPAGKDPNERTFGPDGLERGWADLIHAYAVPDANHGELIARVGSGDAAQPFSIGLTKDVTMPVAGRLFLGINQSYKDAQAAKGSFQVTIEVLAAGRNTAAAMAVGGPPETKLLGFTPDLLDSIPRRVSDHQGNAGDMVNIFLVGTKEQLLHVFTAAGWVKVDSDVQSTVISGLIDTIQKKDYLTMPMSTLYLFKHPQDYGFAHAEPVRVAMSRNHLRVWESPYLIEGRPLWCVAATHDIGFERDERNNGVTHKIDPDVDKEREYVNDTLSGTGLVSARQHITPPDPLTEARTATGGTFRSDGRVLVLILENTKPVTTSGK